MQIGDFKKFNNGVTVICGYCDFYNVHMIDIDEYRIELSDEFGMVIGTISTDGYNNCEIINYDKNGFVTHTNDLKDL